jgi:MoaA/NifB/PqqE/SkfB family radical SAM enzyme
MTIAPPTHVVWDITYTCPLRCTHCYSESGRRPSRQLSPEDNLRIADRIIGLGPAGVGLAGGEALTVPGVFDVVERLMAAGLEVFLYTGGWPVKPRMMDDIKRLRPRIHVSVDAAAAQVHDRIRGRAGSFDRAMQALVMLDDAAREVRESGDGTIEFGIDATIVRSSYDHLEAFCTEIAPRFPELGFLALSAVVPSGLANRRSYAEAELLDPEQVERLAAPATTARLRALAPPSVQVMASSNWAMAMRPDLVEQGRFFRACAIEPDGELRAMCIYEGTVGNILTEDPAVLWERAVARWHDPFVIEALSGVRTPLDWAAAARRLDLRFGSEADRARIAQRPVFIDAVAASA